MTVRKLGSNLTMKLKPAIPMNQLRKEAFYMSLRDTPDRSQSFKMIKKMRMMKKVRMPKMMIMRKMRETRTTVTTKTT